ncbi:MAG TPA: helix-turn-helix transcriptional regulator [Candidatus Polarisedimenticolia bacterium]|jgi:transcriptional regulator with XRE-family HTH domain|nr:helix-turn-helix transcriptional regulator [Candidatus Polarisedimenticolia bacterium]
MDPLNKKEIGKRIKRLRKEKDLKQWQMADILGATQPAIHKYENGILPEVKRLLELARVGNTTVEWILTGRHWENGSEEREKIPVDVYRLAERFHRFTDGQRRTLTSALDMLEKACQRIREKAQREFSDADLQDVGRVLRDFDLVTRKAIAAALGVHEAVMESLVDSQVRDFQTLSSPPAVDPDEEKETRLTGAADVQE